eukprot:m.92210 g.92210  ORF g.92210 m.92210 type:complete len:776 (-) comp14657_c3_seq2:542-2869(-)
MATRAASRAAALAVTTAATTAVAACVRVHALPLRRCAAALSMTAGSRSTASRASSISTVSRMYAARPVHPAGSIRLNSTTSSAPREHEHVHININGRQFEAEKDQTVLDVARQHGLYIPTLCHHPSLKPVGLCRLCLVDVGEKRLVPACTTHVREGMTVQTHTKEIEDEVKAMLALLRTRHPMQCATCSANGSCEFQDLLMRYQVEDPKWLGHDYRKSAVGRTHDHSSPAIQLDLDKCVLCTRCVRACQELQGMNILGIASRGPYESVSPIMGKPLAETPCISCGACAAVCPVGAIKEVPHVFDVMHLLEGDYSPESLSEDEVTRLGGTSTVRRNLAKMQASKASQVEAPAKSSQYHGQEEQTHSKESSEQPRRLVTVVQTAPAVRVTLGEAFGMEPGTITAGKLTAALKALGFDYVFDTNFTADLTIMEEGSELLERIHHGGVFPMMTSCCPAWINLVEKTYPDLIPHLSSAKSPQQMLGALAKTYFAQRIGVHPEDIRVVSIMPCTAKKDEAARPNLQSALPGKPDVDYVLTTRELATLINMHRPPIHFNNLPDATYDSLLGQSTGAGVIFGVTGGVMEAALRTAMALTTPPTQPAPPMPRLEFHEVRGLEGVREATVDLNGTPLRVAIAHGGASLHKICREVLRAKRKGEPPRYHFIELMACRGGCIGGAGNPKDAITTDLLQRRAKAIYSLDEAKTLRRSHENPEVQKIYKEFLGKPLGERSEELLHTSYTDKLHPHFANGEHFWPPNDQNGDDTQDSETHQDVSSKTDKD